MGKLVMARISFTQEQVDEINARRGKVVDHEIKKTCRKAHEPNKTESRFKYEMLWNWERTRLIEGYKFHAIALIWPEYRYTPDWMTWNKDGQITLIEVKGPHVHSRDSRVRFLTARRDYPWFNFECWQWKERMWKEIWK
jgi:hypothetical protein